MLFNTVPLVSRETSFFENVFIGAGGNQTLPYTAGDACYDGR